MFYNILSLEYINLKINLNIKVYNNKDNIVKMDIIKQFEENLNKQTPKLSNNTIKNYLSSLSNILEVLYTDNLEFIKSPKTTIESLQKYYGNNINTLISKINILLVLIKIEYQDKDYPDYYKEYEIFRNKLRGEIKKEYEKHEATETQLNKATSIAEDTIIEKSLLKLVKHSIKTTQDILNLRNYLIYKFLQVKQTRGDFIQSKLILYKPENVYDDSYNYIIINKKDKSLQYIQNQYKTMKKHGQVQHNVDNHQLYKYFIKLYNAYKKLKVEGEWCFYNEDLKDKMNENTLSILYKRFGNKYINRPISIQVMRVESTSKDIDIEKIESTAKSQGHTMNTALSIYTKKDFKKK